MLLQLLLLMLQLLLQLLALLAFQGCLRMVNEVVEPFRFFEV